MRSSMGFQGTDGVSAYDAAGELAFRVDNYSRRPKLLAGELLLMDGRGLPLLSLRPQIISMHDQWNCYRSASPEDECQGKSARSSQRLFSVRKCSALLQSSREAEVFFCTTTAADRSASDHGGPSFWVEGCFLRRSCKIRRGSDGEEVARIARKKAGAGDDNKAGASTLLGEDVFSLVVQPGVDSMTIMAIVVVLDRICRRPYTPLMCSS